MRLFLRLLGFLRPYGGRVALSAALGAATVVSGVGLLATAAYVISAAALQPLLGELALAVYLVRFFSVSRAFSRYAERLVSHGLTFRLLQSLRTFFYARLEPLAPARLSGYRSGDLLSRFVRDVEELENVFLRILSPFVVAVLVSLLTFAVLLPFDRTLALVALGFLAATGVGVPLLVRRLSRGLGRRELGLRAELGARILDGVSGARDLLAFGREGAEKQEISALDRKLEGTQRRSALVAGLQESATETMTGLALVAVLVLSVPLVAAGEIEGVWLAFLALVVLGSFEAVAPLGTAFRSLDRSLSAGRRLFEVTDAEPGARDPEDPLPPPEDHAFELDRVSFRYEPAGPPVLDEVSLRLPPGRKVAVVGPSGSGKSTILALLLRFYDPDEGSVRFGGQDARSYAADDLRAGVAVAPQDPHVFAGTLRENLLVADPEADEGALRRVLRRARLEDFVRALPEGLDEYVGEGGSRLSGGERRRLAVARALLKGAPILALDEPTADLDRLTEGELLSSILDPGQEKSLLLVTHRLVGLEAMDEILVLDAGRVVERGTHAELAGAGGLYNRMRDVQNGMLATA
ncbi:thiol reductant ABC exporter subunit CydC [Rubrobacter marinus]|uniref:thiol reductant ABC exporter subunit CydC n=1 Tax=Rubrobacter marinus TaxID=2653852 RepID=UPI00140DA8DF|nr:thiol reductant ABC exporter subunit CydC [Rubrobacter marinus]